MLRAAFARWGLPDRIRVDHGHPWGKWDLPAALVLWLHGLGVEVVRNPPARPRKNARVERCQGVLQRWAEPRRCPDAAELRRRLAWAEELQRERYPSVGGRPRAAAYPGLLRPRRPYERATEAERWDVGRAHAALAARWWWRRVGRSGRFSLYNREYAAGRSQAGREVLVRLDAATAEWVVCDAAGTELRRHAAPELSRERIPALDVGRPDPRHPVRRRERSEDAG